MRWPWRRRPEPPIDTTGIPSEFLVRYMLCPVCHNLAEQYEVRAEVIEVTKPEPAWPGGPLVEVPGMLPGRRAGDSTWTFHPCGCTTTNPRMIHAVSVPMNTSRARVLAMLRAG